MATLTTDRPRRSWLMRLVRLSPAVMLLAFVAGLALLAIGHGLPEAEASKEPLQEAGATVLLLDGVLFVVVLWGGVYLMVVEASRGMPGLWSVQEPTMTPERAAAWEELRRSLAGLGFRHVEWFSLDDFDQTHVSAWEHGEHAAFVLYDPVGGGFRLRIVRKFPSGGILVSSSRLNDLACPPPQGLYVQARKAPTVEELWAWHLEGEALFPDHDAPGDRRVGGVRGLYVEMSARRAGHRRRDRTWLLAVEPFGECWRMYWLCGMPLRRQFDLGWTTPYWK